MLVCVCKYAHHFPNVQVYTYAIDENDLNSCSTACDVYSFRNYLSTDREHDQVEIECPTDFTFLVDRFSSIL